MSTILLIVAGYLVFVAFVLAVLTAARRADQLTDAHAAALRGRQERSHR